MELPQQGAHVFELRDGKVVRLEIFATGRRRLGRRTRDTDARDRVG